MSTTTQNTCAQCDAPLADDQRYCLECGARRNGARLPFNEIARPAEAPPPAPPGEPGTGGIKGRRPSKKDKLRALQAPAGTAARER